MAPTVKCRQRLDMVNMDAKIFSGTLNLSTGPSEQGKNDAPGVSLPQDLEGMTRTVATARSCSDDVWWELRENPAWFGLTTVFVFISI